MTEKKKSFFQSIRALHKNFWIASFMELLERWAWYGIYTLFGIYLVGSTDTGGLGFNHIQKGHIMGNIVGILYFLPIIFGVIADRIGYKKSLAISYLIMIAGYYLLGEMNTYGGVYAAFLLVAIGAAFFKPVASAIVARVTDESTSTIGFGIFYMMVNIGGFIGPAMSSFLRTQFGWKIIFIQASVVIGINLLTLLIFYREEKFEKPKDSIGKALKDAVLNILGALKDIRLSILLVLMIGFWTMFNQLFNTLPNFIEDWVDSHIISNWINENLPALGAIFTQNGQVKPEWFTNIDALMIIFFQVIVSFFVTRIGQINSVIRGAIIATIGIGLSFYFGNVWFTIIGTMIFAVGEMMSSPTVSSFIALITPKGKEGLYQGTYFLPVGVSYFVTSFISGDLYQKWSDKLSLLQIEMSNRNIDMPEVITKEQFIEAGAEALHMPISAFEDQFNLKTEGKINWMTVSADLQEYATSKGIDISQIHLPLSKNEYFALAEQKLDMTHWEMTEMLWNTYDPNKIWYVIVGIGVFSIVTLKIYQKLVIGSDESTLTHK